MSLSLSLKPRVLRTYDSDAAAYILSVEAADGQSLERGVKDAITEFVIGCKIRGIWDAIKSCCLLCGARTLSGILVPLKGPSPTSFQFNNNDYNRETGLKGNGINKWINTNFSSSSTLVEPNDFHFAFFISVLNGNVQTTGETKSYMADGGLNMYRSNSARTFTQFNINSSFGGTVGDVSMANTSGFCGLSRSSDNAQSIRIGSKNINYNVNSVGSDNDTMRLFGRNGTGVMGEFSDGRISFYSIGQSINLKLLQECVDNLSLRLRQFFRPSSLHPDITMWINRISQIISLKEGDIAFSSNTLAALNTFCNNLETTGIRSKIYRLNLFLGNSLSYCRVPFYVGSDNNTIYGSRYDDLFNFTEGAYNSEIGLTANGSSTRIETNFLTSLLMEMFPSTHLAYYCTILPTNTNSFFKTVLSTQSGWGLGSTGVTTNRIGANSVTGVAYALGSRILSRTSDSSLCLYDNGVLKSRNTTANVVPNFNYAAMRIMASRIENNLPSEFINGSFSCYSMGLGLTEQEAIDYSNILNAFNNSIGRNI